MSHNQSFDQTLYREETRAHNCRPENAGEENLCEDQIEENLATYVGGGPPPCRTPELGYIWRSTLTLIFRKVYSENRIA